MDLLIAFFISKLDYTNFASANGTIRNQKEEELNGDKYRQYKEIGRLTKNKHYKFKHFLFP